MLQRYALGTFSAASFRGQSFPALQQLRTTYSSHSRSSDDETDFDAAREWYRGFNKSTIPLKIATTTFSCSSGPGGQKTNKTASKATTTWSVKALMPHVPKVLHRELRACRYYASSSDSIVIQCDSDRSQTSNEKENFERLTEEITKMYKKRVPGVTSAEQKQRVEKIKSLARLSKDHSYNDQAAQQHKLRLKQAIVAERRSTQGLERQKKSAAERKAQKETAEARLFALKGKKGKKGKGPKS
ncbi:uncharacterized protein PAC_14133 [Phialocephala subalpina]|uniref:Prokaryotic-type class I peptide chain release factors domain-containing protein n=1 Tax=Phialocephala subalpina TaxID=576137 RepID=A0A1L7XGQ9_9HELO|nr:uncharacterized protein PAC_14133 [Phialocephala subalpina]